MKKLILLGLLFSSLSFGASDLSSMVPPGTIINFAGSTCPTGYLSAAGTSLLRAGKYAKLFAAISTTYGAADGTHFTLPNALGVFLRGAGAQTVDGIAYSYSLANKVADSMQGHYHSVTDPGHTHTGSTTAQFRTGPGDVVSDAGSEYTWATGSITVNSNTTGLTVTAPTTNGSNGTPRTGSETKPVALAVTYCIKY